MGRGVCLLKPRLQLLRCGETFSIFLACRISLLLLHFNIERRCSKVLIPIQGCFLVDLIDHGAIYFWPPPLFNWDIMNIFIHSSQPFKIKTGVLTFSMRQTISPTLFTAVVYKKDLYSSNHIFTSTHSLPITST